MSEDSVDTVHTVTLAAQSQRVAGEGTCPKCWDRCLLLLSSLLVLVLSDEVKRHLKGRGWVLEWKISGENWRSDLVQTLDV